MSLEEPIEDISSRAARRVYKLLSLLEEKAPEDVKQVAKKHNVSVNQVLRYVEILGSLEEVLKLLETREDTLLKTIRTNTIKITLEKLVKRLTDKGFKVKPYTPTPYGIIVEYAPYSLGSTDEYLQGYYTIQGPASMLAVLALSPDKADISLDCCAGAGIKTTQIAQHTKNPIIAVDINKRKLLALKNNLSRLGVINVVAIEGDARKLHRLPEKLEFTHILVDAPCTGEGLLPFSKGRWPRKPEDVASRVKLQVELLAATLTLLAPGGRLVYSTCSISVEENEYVVSTVAELFNDVKLVEPQIPGTKGVTEYYDLEIIEEAAKCRRLYPHIHHTEGFTICLLEKS